MKKTEVTVFHNILWSRYKGAVFSELHSLSTNSNSIDINFIQIAATERARIALTGVDLNIHQYPYRLLFDAPYEDVGKARLCLKLVTTVYNLESDIVVLPGYSLIEHWLMLGMAKLKGKTTFVFCDSTFFDRPQKRYKRWLKKVFFGICENALCYGQRSKAYVVAHGITTERAFLRCQAAALPVNYSENYERARIASSDWSTVRIRTFLYVGRLSSEKNLARLLEAFAQLLKESCPTEELRLVLIGDGPDRFQLEALSKSAGLSKHVIFAGSLASDRLEFYYQSAYALILPSLSEPWGLVVNEAMSYGCPCLVSLMCGCVPELVADGSTGLTFDPKKVHEITASMRWLLSKWHLRREFGLNCLDIIATYTTADAARQMHGAFLTAASERRG